MIRLAKTMRNQPEQRSKVWFAFTVVLALIAGVVFAWFRAGRRDYVLLLDAKTGKTIADLPLGWQLVGETPTKAIVEREGKTKLIALPASTEQDMPSTEKAFAVGWSIFPAIDLSWLGRPQETTSPGRIAFVRVDGTDVVLVQTLKRNLACFSLSLLDAKSGNQRWKIDTDFERDSISPPVATVPALGPPPGPGREPTRTSPDGFPLAPTRIGLTTPPPIPLAPPPPGLVGPPTTTRQRVPLQAPDGSYPCPALRGVSLGRSLVAIESDNRFMVFDRATGAAIGEPVDVSPSPMARLLGDLTLRYDVDNLMAEDPRSGLVVWKLRTPSGTYQFETSQINDPYAYILSPDQLTAIGQDGKIRWATNRGKPGGQPRFFGGSGRVNLTVAKSTVVALTTTGVNGYESVTGSLLWKRKFGNRTLGLQVGRTNRVVSVTTAHYVSD